jgi:hypothetical protein
MGLEVIFLIILTLVSRASKWSAGEDWVAVAIFKRAASRGVLLLLEVEDADGVVEEVVVEGGVTVDPIALVAGAVVVEALSVVAAVTVGLPIQ